MNTLTQQQINQYQWQVADGVAKAVNPYFQDTRGEKGTFFDLHNGEYAEFERLYGSTRLNTNAPDGIYSGEVFEEPVWQYWNGSEWEFEEHQSEHEWSVSEGLDTRLFLRLKPSQLPAVLTIQPGEEWEDRYNKVEEYTHDGINWVVPKSANELYVEKECGSKIRTTWHLITPPAEQEAETVDPYQALFNHISQEHGLILTQSEMAEIIHIVEQPSLTQKDQRIAELEKEREWIPIEKYNGNENILRWHKVWNCPVTVKPAPKTLDLPWMDGTHTNAWPEEAFTPVYQYIQTPPQH